VGGDLIIESHFRLTELRGLKNLASVGGDIIIDGNEALTRIDPFESLTSISNNLEIKNNPILPTLAFIFPPALTSLAGSLVIEGNDTITSLVGLDSLLSISGDMVVKDNGALTTLENLSGLLSIGGDLIIGTEAGDDGARGNVALTRMGLSGLSAVGGGFSVVDNYQLCTHLAEDLRDQIGEENIGGTVRITHNKACAPP
jgi:hypothetical protein